MLRTSFWLFSFYFLIAALFLTPPLVGLPTVVGSQMLAYYDRYKHYGILLLVGTIFFLWMLIRLVVPLFSVRGRRWLVSSFQDKIHKALNMFS